MKETKKKYLTNNIPSVAVMLATFNGESHIKEQLISIVNQNDIYLDVYISDDGSSDNTLKIIDIFAKENPNYLIKIFKGPRKGFAKNFISMLSKIKKEYDYYAFSDQDDTWDFDKLDRAIFSIEEYNKDDYNLYFSRTRAVDFNGNKIGMSPIFNRKPSFQNALVQSIGGGNTSLFNKNSFNLILKYTENANFDYVSHDWLIYIIITAVGGNVNYDKKPSVNYRQHKTNVIGSNLSLKAKFKRSYDLFVNNIYLDWNEKHIKFLDNLDIHPKNINVYNNYKKCRDNSLQVRVISFFRSGIHRQTSLATLIIFITVIMKKF